MCEGKEPFHIALISIGPMPFDCNAGMAEMRATPPPLRLQSSVYAGTAARLPFEFAYDAAWFVLHHFNMFHGLSHQMEKVGN